MLSRPQRGTRPHAPGLGEELIDEILSATRRAQENPELFRIVYREASVRRVLTNRLRIASSSRSSVKRSMCTRFFTAHDMIAGGRNDSRHL